MGLLGDAQAGVETGDRWQDFRVNLEVSESPPQWTVEELNHLIHTKPTSAIVRRFRPADKILDDVTKANDKNDPHGLKHFAETFVLQELMAQTAVERGVKLRRNVLRWAAVLHDMAGMGERRVDHASIAAEWAQNNLSDSLEQEELECLVGVLKWHEADDEKVPLEAWSEELKYFKDADAAGLLRFGVDKSILKMRTEEGKRVLDVAELLIVEGSKTHTGDAYQDVIQAAENLELLEASGRVDVFQELARDNSFIAHGVSGNMERGVQIRTTGEVWMSIFRSGKIVNPESRSNSWSEAEQRRYRFDGDAPGDRARLYGCVANERVGIGGRNYTGGGMLLAPTRSSWINGAVISSDQDRDVRAITPISITNYDRDGKYLPIEIPVSECLVVLPVEGVIEQIDNIIKFCDDNGLNAEEWIRSHVIIADPSATEEESLLLEATRRCRQDGDLITEETDLTRGATRDISQLTTEVVVGSREVRLKDCSVQFTAPDRIPSPKLLEKRINEFVRLAEIGYFSRENNDYYIHGPELTALTKVARVFGLNEKTLLEQPQVVQYFKDLEMTVLDENGWIDENATLIALFPDSITGSRQLFSGSWYEKTETGWIKDRIPSYDEF